jgi:branched-chain amino acid aminotransferase
VPGKPGSALYIRPTLVATEAFLGVRPARRYTLFVILSPVDPYYGEDLAPQRIWVEEELSRAAPGGLGAVKASGNYAASLLAARRAQERGYAQVLWLDAAEHRHVEELGMMNVFLKVDGALVTPPLHGTILGGITRDSIIRLARGWGMAVREEPVTLDDVRRDAASGRLEEVFGCGTAAVVAPVGELGTAGGPIVVGGGGVGPVARRLYEAIGAIQRGAAPDLLGWTETLT